METLLYELLSACSGQEARTVYCLAHLKKHSLAPPCISSDS